MLIIMVLNFYRNIRSFKSWQFGITISKKNNTLERQMVKRLGVKFENWHKAGKRMVVLSQIAKKEKRMVA